MPLRRASKSGLRLKALRAVYSLRLLELKLSSLEGRVQAELELAKSTLAKLQAHGMHAEAAALAAEAAEKEKILRTAAFMRASVERIRARLETMLEAGVVVGALKDLEGMLSELKKSGLSSLPELSLMISDAEAKIAELVEELPSVEAAPASSGPVHDEVKMILKEASEVAALRERSFEGALRSVANSNNKA